MVTEKSGIFILRPFSSIPAFQVPAILPSHASLDTERCHWKHPREGGTRDGHRQTDRPLPRSLAPRFLSLLLARSPEGGRAAAAAAVVAECD